MCTILQVNRSTYYYENSQQSSSDDEVELAIIRIFEENQRVYGTRKIKAVLQKEGQTVSRRRIGRWMRKNGLVSAYTFAQYKPKKSPCNESAIQNELNREFTKDEPLEAAVSDLTYVRVANKWHYICLLVDLFNREIIEYSCGTNKDAAFVYRAFASEKEICVRFSFFTRIVVASSPIVRLVMSFVHSTSSALWAWKAAHMIML